jgi:2-methylcitrate dehydratase PrpD
MNMKPNKDNTKNTDTFDPTTEMLATYIVDLEFDDIPNRVVEKEQWHLLDTLGCILYGSTTPWVQTVIDAIEKDVKTGTISILGDGRKLPPSRAVLVNGMASHSMDFDDTCKPGVHAGSAVLPSALAYMERTDEEISGKEFLTAIVAGVEVGIRTGYGIGRESLKRGLHIAGWTGAFAAAATTGKLHQLSKNEMGHALAIAGTQGSGFGAEVKRYHMGRAAESGYLAALYAQESLTGDRKIFSDRYGSIGPALSGDGKFDTETCVNQLGENYELLQRMHLKPFPSIISVHPPVSGVHRILNQQDIKKDEVDRVTVWCSQVTKDKVGWPYEPEGVMSAQGNIQYAIASLLIDGELTIDAYTPEAIQRIEILEFVENINIISDNLGEDSRSYEAKVELKTDSGSTYKTTVSEPLGSPNNPMSDTELRSKFRNQAKKTVPTNNIDPLIDFMTSVKNQKSANTIFDYLAIGE